MDKFKTIAAALTISLLIGTTATAQDVNVSLLKGSGSVYHEISFGGTASASGILQTFSTLQTLDGDKNEVKPSFSTGGGLQINYILHFNESVSLTIGAAAKYSRSAYGFDLLDENSAQRWASSIEDTFSFTANIRNYTETHSALHLQIPLLFGYEAGTPLAKWYINAGVAAQFTVHSKYVAKISRLTTRSYSYYNNGNLEGEGIPDLGIGTVNNIEVSGKPTLKFTVNGYLETGTKISIGKGAWMYIGAFGEISALKNSVSETGNGKENLINYAPAETPSNNLMDNLDVTSITNTKYTSGGRTYAFGGIIRFGFDFHTSNRMFSDALR
jgi:hypothetical protein